jgi:IS5 family transposase
MTPATGSDPDAALATLSTLGPLPNDITVALDAAYDSDTTRATLAERDLQGQIAQKGTPAPIQATNRWPAHLRLGNQYGKLRWCTERRRLVVEF